MARGMESFVFGECGSDPCERPTPCRAGGPGRERLDRHGVAIKVTVAFCCFSDRVPPTRRRDPGACLRSIDRFAPRRRQRRTGPSAGGPIRRQRPRSVRCPLLYTLASFTRSIYGSTISRTMLRMQIDRDEPIALHDQVRGGDPKGHIRRRSGPRRTSAVGKGHRCCARCEQEHSASRPAHVARGRAPQLTWSRRHGGRRTRAGPRGERAREFIAFARRYGYRRDDVLNLIKELP